MVYEEEKGMRTYYFTIVGTQYRYGHEFLETDMKVKLVKEPDNEVDPEAIKVMIEAVLAKLELYDEE